MPAVSLNQRSRALRSGWVALLQVFLDSFNSSFSVFAGSPVQSFDLHNVCCPNASCWFWCSVLSFYRLEQAPNTVSYAMSKREDSNERFNLNFGS